MIQVEGISAGENLKTVLDEQDSIIDQLQAALDGKAFPKGVSLDVITAASLPATVVDNQIVVITSTAASNIYVSTNEPDSPISGDIWVRVAKGEYGVRLSDESPYCDLYFTAAKQYGNGAWSALSGYVGVLGSWKMFSQSFPAIGTPLASWSWEDIIRLANSTEDVTQYFAIGDEKPFQLATGENVTAVIGAFHHNIISGTDKKAALAFTFKNCLSTKSVMNNTATNSGGWKNTLMCKTRMTEIFASFPAVLKEPNAIKYVGVLTTIGSKSLKLETTSERLRLHSQHEVGLTANWSEVEEGATYPYYAAGNRIKTVAGTASLYWLRSPTTDNVAAFCQAAADGTAWADQATASAGIAPCFDI